MGTKVTKQDETLDDLARGIETEHRAVASALVSALEHAIAAGDLLIKAKAKVPPGQWLSWLQANSSVPRRTASHYMNLANRRKDLSDQMGNTSPIGVNEALALLRPPELPLPPEAPLLEAPELEDDERAAREKEHWAGAIKNVLEMGRRLAEFVEACKEDPKLMAETYENAEKEKRKPEREPEAMIEHYRDLFFVNAMYIEDEKLGWQAAEEWAHKYVELMLEYQDYYWNIDRMRGELNYDPANGT